MDGIYAGNFYKSPSSQGADTERAVVPVAQGPRGADRRVWKEGREEEHRLVLRGEGREATLDHAC